MKAEAELLENDLLVDRKILPLLNKLNRLDAWYVMRPYEHFKDDIPEEQTAKWREVTSEYVRFRRELPSGEPMSRRVVAWLSDQSIDDVNVNPRWWSNYELAVKGYILAGSLYDRFPISAELHALISKS